MDSILNQAGIDGSYMKEALKLNVQHVFDPSIG